MSVTPFDLEQQICFRSPESAAPLIQRLTSEQAELCIHYEKQRKNRREMLALLRQQRAAQLFIELEEPPVLFTKEEALQIREAIDAARSFIQCGAPAGATVHNELNNAVALIGKATE